MPALGFFFTYVLISPLKSFQRTVPECRTAPGYPSRSEPSYKNRILLSLFAAGSMENRILSRSVSRCLPAASSPAAVSFPNILHPSAYPSIGNPASHKACARCGGLSRTFRPHGRGFHTPRLPGYSESGPAQPATAVLVLRLSSFPSRESLGIFLQ